VAGVEPGHLPHGKLDLTSRRAIDLIATAPVDVHVHQPRRHQHVAEIQDGVGQSGGRPGAHLAYRSPVYDHERVLQ
jgi:hypothetical protein